jgi:hypothetical protein
MSRLYDFLSLFWSLDKSGFKRALGETESSGETSNPERVRILFEGDHQIMLESDITRREHVGCVVFGFLGGFSFGLLRLCIAIRFW